MNWDQVEGMWKDLKGTFREKWAKLTDDDLELIAGKKDRLVGKLQKEYGLQKEQAEEDADSWLTSVGEGKKHENRIVH
jgi:uncharacterized protein YjbJ (UPF0337 family)